jgi:4-amino-4-deoxy-L-arabinose transferase-like glycosyltransferase
MARVSHNTRDDAMSRYKAIDLVSASLLILLVVAVCAPLLLKFPPPGGDEPGFIDPAINLLRQGHLGTTLYGGLIPGMARHVYWQPPLYFLVLAVWFKADGIGLIQARLLSVVLGAAVILIVYAYSRRFASAGAAFAAAALCSITIWCVIPFRVARMEPLCVSLILASALLYERATDTGHTADYGVCGLLAGLAALSHPMGLITPAAVAVDMMIRFRTRVFIRRETYALLIPFLACLAAWAIYILQDFPSFLAQMDLQMARKRYMRPAFIQFILYAKTHVATVLLAFLGAIWCAYRAVNNGPRLRFLAVICLTSLVFFYVGEESEYFVYWIPVSLIAVAPMLEMAKHRRFVVSLFVLAAITELGSRGVNFARHDHQSYAVYSRVIYTSIPAGRSIVSIEPGYSVSPYFAVRGRNPLTLIPPLPVGSKKIEAVIASKEYVVSVSPLDTSGTLASSRQLIGRCLQGGFFDLYIYGPAHTQN